MYDTVLLDESCNIQNDERKNVLVLNSFVDPQRLATRHILTDLGVHKVQRHIHKDNSCGLINVIKDELES